jgi:hypothetical protein
VETLQCTPAARHSSSCQQQRQQQQQQQAWGLQAALLWAVMTLRSHLQCGAALALLQQGQE